MWMQVLRLVFFSEDETGGHFHLKALCEEQGEAVKCVLYVISSLSGIFLMVTRTKGQTDKNVIKSLRLKAQGQLKNHK